MRAGFGDASARLTGMGNGSRELIVTLIARPTGDRAPWFRATIPRRGPLTFDRRGQPDFHGRRSERTCRRDSAALGSIGDLPFGTPLLGAGFENRSRLFAIRRWRLKLLASFKRWKGLRHGFLRANPRARQQVRLQPARLIRVNTTRSLVVQGEHGEAKGSRNVIPSNPTSSACNTR